MSTALCTCHMEADKYGRYVFPVTMVRISLKHHIDPYGVNLINTTRPEDASRRGANTNSLSTCNNASELSVFVSRKGIVHVVNRDDVYGTPNRSGGRLLYNLLLVSSGVRTADKLVTVWN